MLDPAKRAIRALLESVRRSRRARQLRQDQRHVTRDELVADLARLGIARGDTLFVHSSLKSIGYVEGGAATVVAALQQAIGSEGTLLIPTYYLPGGTVRATCELADYVFDPRRHGTNMGRLPEAFLRCPGVLRSIHPTHSVSAWGRHAARVTQDHHRAPSIFGTGSPWQRFVECDNAKVLGLGISMGPVTFYHLLEDCMGASFPLPVWEPKTFLLPCLDFDGARWEVPVRPFDPSATRGRIDYPERADLREFFGKEFDRTGLRVNGKVGEASAWYIPARGFLDHLRTLAGENVTIYSSAAQLAARPIA